MTKDELWIKAMEIGARSGCHQMPERSFFINGYQFPVCARCTGVIIGHTAALVMLAVRKKIPVPAAAALLLTMGADWFAQHIGLRESTNVRRLITGVMGGLGIAFIYADLIKKIISKAADRS